MHELTSYPQHTREARAQAAAPRAAAAQATEARRLDPADPRFPRHVAIVMDGNRRWAKARGRSALAGHRAGADAVRTVVTAARELGVRYLTLYAFSTENWRRPSLEVRGLMALLTRFLVAERPTMLDNGVRLAAIGDRDRLPARALARLEETERLTAHLDGMQLTLALSYGGRDDIVRAAKRVAEAVQRGEIDPASVDEATIAAHLDTAAMPDPDLVIRTGGEHRLSNFLLWQVAYAELHVVETPWPAFGPDELARALDWYAARARRFGR